MFKIAFTSCMSSSAYSRSQPVWSRIRREQPDVLVLLGDSIYNDVPCIQDSDGSTGPSEDGYDEDLFTKHMIDLYNHQLAVPEFKELLKAHKLEKYAIWDDHDFLWNNADARRIDKSWHKLPKAIRSANLMQCWREALDGNPMPSSTDTNRTLRYLLDEGGQEIPGRNLDYHAAMNALVGYSCKLLFKKNICLHLTDGRSWRGFEKDSLLGSEQRTKIEAQMDSKPTAIHIIASGSTFGKKSKSGWGGYPSDQQWMLGLAEKYKILMISGDIHEIALPDPIQCGAKHFYEATASGAAVNFFRDKPDEKDSLGRYTEKFGLLTIDDQLNVDIALYDHNVMQLQRPIPSTF